MSALYLTLHTDHLLATFTLILGVMYYPHGVDGRFENWGGLSLSQDYYSIVTGGGGTQACDTSTHTHFTAHTCSQSTNGRQGEYKKGTVEDVGDEFTG